ncbi:MAG: hypothetical protein IPK13_16090 [Deltaproteobacteria bacterium]|nr:hypothetical protein [Deltaproteobacteria bacterium]
MAPGGWVTAWLRRASVPVFSAFAIAAAFSTYFSMYGFRKPFAVGTFAGEVDVLGVVLDYKILLILAQVVGYCGSKFAGIKVVSEMSAARRGLGILALIAVAEVALLFFALTPRPYNAVWLFVNGLPLGMVWGLVFGFLEGRRVSEVLGVGLSASYIVASGFVKSVGRWLMDAGVSERWMPFAAGLLFVGPIIVSVWALAQLPPPSAEDAQLRTVRAPMNGRERSSFFLAYAPGLSLLTILYMLLTAYRDFRDNFAREIWDALGYGETPSVLTTAEVPIALGVLAALAFLMTIRDNRRALLAIHGIMFGGTVLIGLSTWGFRAGLIGPVAWMIAVGLGLYLAYVPYGCMLFDRLIAAVGFVGTAGFMIYVTDAFGYLGSVLVLLYKNFGQANLSWMAFFTNFSYLTSIACSIAMGLSFLYFTRLQRPTPMGSV